MQDQDVDDHDGGLAVDLKVIQRQMMGRRRALAWLGFGGATALVAACGGGSSSSGTSSTTAATTTDSSSSSSTTSSTSSSSTSSSSSSSSSERTTSCVASPQATSGPYPADGTNTSEGSTSDALTASGIERSDIRDSFISGTDAAPGVTTTITITLVNSNNNCEPLEGYAIYFWQCDANGDYSLYGAPTESYLRGVQVTDSNGQVTFITVFPACYSGRWPHQHFEIYSSLSEATNGKNAVLTSQFAMPEDVAAALYSSDSSVYKSSTSNLESVSLSSDLVFSAFSSAQLTEATPTFSGSASAGYTETATIGLDV